MKYKHAEKYIFKAMAYIMFLFIPLITFAQGGGNVCSGPFSTGSVSGVFLWPACIINKYLIPMAIGLEFILLISGIVIYMTNADNESKRQEGSAFMLWGVIALFVTLSVWALVAFIRNTLQI